MTKSTRRALLSSVVALVICLTMLIGTTFAWFTDTASTAVNTIKSGTLDVELVDANGNSLEGKTLSWKTYDNRDNENILWEPGCTYELETVYIKNNGNLALKYEVVISGINGSAKLNDVIDWTITGNDAGNIISGGDNVAVNIKGHMQETADNTYMGEKIEGIAITVVATQYTYEYDSNNNTYDADAEYPEVVTLLKQSEYTSDNTKKLGSAAKEDFDEDLVIDGCVFIIDEDSLIYNDCYFLGYAFAYYNSEYYAVGGPTDNASIRKSITLKNCTFIDQTGKAKLIWGNEFNNVDVTVENCTFNGFKLAFQVGQNTDNNSTLTVKNSTINADRGISLSGYVKNAKFDGNNFNLSTDANDYFINVAATDLTVSVTNNEVTTGNVLKLHSAVKDTLTADFSGLTMSGNTYPTTATNVLNEANVNDAVVAHVTSIIG